MQPSKQCVQNNKSQDNRIKESTLKRVGTGMILK